VVLGDVSGKGASAAVLTSLARYTVRAAALRTPYPSAVLATLHEGFVRYHPDHFCTAVFLVLEAGAGGVRATVTSGGHHLPLRFSPDGRVETIGEPGSILGMLDTPRLRDTSAVFAPGDVVVLYTDGVVEARRDREFFDEERLVAAVLAAGFGDAQQIAEAVVRSAVDFQGENARDDIGVVVIRVP
jgi:sigma-B regulation protein RsbU (phosphoserine phosphatase)